MSNSSWQCEHCSTRTADIACGCNTKLPKLCRECITYHFNKPSSEPHLAILISEIDHITGYDELHVIKMRKLNIDGAKSKLDLNLAEIERCREDIKARFSMLVDDINRIRDQHLEKLQNIEEAVQQVINRGVGDATKHVGAQVWHDSFGDAFANFMWNFTAGRDTPEMFSFSVSEPSTFISNLIKVSMNAKVEFASVAQDARLALIVDGNLRLFTVKSKTWSSIELNKEKMQGFKHNAHSSLAFYEDGNSLLCTGGGTPVTPLCTQISLDGSITDLQPMRSPRSGHGFCQLNNHFYAFGGYGSKRTAEKFTQKPGEHGRWDLIAGMVGTHEWFTACVSNGKVVLCGGDSKIVEEFDPATETFRKLDFQLSGILAESSLSVACDVSTLVILSCSNLFVWNRNSDAECRDQPLAKGIRYAWSCMTPIIEVNSVYLANQEEKMIKCLDLTNKLVTEIHPPPQVPPSA